MTEPGFWAVVPAAGVGRRMHSDVPKQYLRLHGQTILDHTIGRLLSHPLISGLFIAIGREDEWWAESKYQRHPDLVAVPGGQERCHSVLNALEALARKADEQAWVLVHDAVRPCVRQSDIDHLIRQLRDHSVGGLLGVPVSDTMKRSDADGLVLSTVDRQGLWHAYTPQMFPLGLLRRAMQRALDDGFIVTDEASAVEHAGMSPMMVEGHRDNIKITRPQDLDLAGHYLAAQEDHRG